MSLYQPGTRLEALTTPFCVVYEAGWPVGTLPQPLSAVVFAVLASFKEAKALNWTSKVKLPVVRVAPVSSTLVNSKPPLPAFARVMIFTALSSKVKVSLFSPSLIQAK